MRAFKHKVIPYIDLYHNMNKREQNDTHILHIMLYKAELHYKKVENRNKNHTLNLLAALKLH